MPFEASQQALRELIAAAEEALGREEKVVQVAMTLLIGILKTFAEATDTELADIVGKTQAALATVNTETLPAGRDTLQRARQLLNDVDAVAKAYAGGVTLDLAQGKWGDSSVEGHLTIKPIVPKGN